MGLYMIMNGAASGAAQPVVAATGTAIKTMLQVASSATATAKIVEWGVSFDGSAAATPIKVELVETSGAATVTASASADITKMDGPALAGGDPTTNLIQIGTTSTGYTASGEGTPGTCRTWETQLIAPTNQYVKQFPLGREPVIQIGKFARIRVTAPAGVNCYAYMIIEV